MLLKVVNIHTDEILDLQSYAVSLKFIHIFDSQFNDNIRDMQNESHLLSVLYKLYK